MNELDGLKAREKMLAMRSQAAAQAAEKKTSDAVEASAQEPRKARRPSKRAQMLKSRPKDAEIFRAAAALLNMTATKDAPKFGVSRQTLAKWMRGETSAPRSAYVLLLDELTHAVKDGTADFNAVASALRIMQKMNRKGGIDA